MAAVGPSPATHGWGQDRKPRRCTHLLGENPRNRWTEALPSPLGGSPPRDGSDAQPRKRRFSPRLPSPPAGSAGGIFFSQVFPDGREISRPKQTATRGACHRLQRSLPRGSVAMATRGGI